MAESEPLVVHDGSGIEVAVMQSRFNSDITSGLLAGATAYLDEARARYEVYEAPGAFELPLICAELAPKYDAVVALGAVINGDTDHYEHVASRASEGLMQISLEARTPIAFGVLTVQERDQAVVRSVPGPGNKGAEAAAAAVETALLLRRISAAR